MTDNDESSIPVRSLLVVAVTLLGLMGSWFWLRSSPNPFTDLTFSLFQIVAVSIVIWQACDPFADAAQWFGERWRLPSSVRGATLDAIASSMPELFSGLFFVIVAIRASNGSSDQISDRRHRRTGCDDRNVCRFGRLQHDADSRTLRNCHRGNAQEATGDRNRFDRDLT